ncbi:MAG: hypothetical protein AAF566_06515 [Pseudomonadota bacterium]
MPSVRLNRLCWMVMLGAIAITLTRAALIKELPFDLLAGSDNDDILRFLSVRDLLAGQGWFDAAQYRILPPEGLPLHWSRYVDAGIAGMMGAFAWLMPLEAAEAATLVAWPLLMLSLLIVIMGTIGRAALGPGAAALAILALIIWPVTSHTYFRTARLDHHNVQIVLMTLMVLALLVPHRPRVFGVLAGSAAALSMAVGLETLPVIVLGGLVVALWASADPGADGARLLGFSGALALGAAAAFAGQTAPGAWLLTRCDQLSLPWLALTLVALTASLCLVIVTRRWSRWAGAVVFALTAVFGLAATFPLIEPCFAGPYAGLPEEVRGLIPRIQEARPAHWFLLHNPNVFFETVAPALAAFFVAGLVWARRARLGLAGTNENRTLGLLMLLCSVALAATFFQIRVIVLTAALVPAMIGYALSRILEARLAAPNAVNALALIAAVALTLMPHILHRGSAALWQTMRAPGTPQTAADDPRGCRAPEVLASLSALSPGVIFNPINIGAPIALLTEHKVLSAPYHRRAEALSNGLAGLSGDAAALRDQLTRSGADYLVLCRDQTYGDSASFATELASGTIVSWLTPLDAVDPALAAFRLTTAR